LCLINQNTKVTTMNILKTIGLTSMTLFSLSFSALAEINQQSDKEFVIQHNFFTHKDVSTTHHEFSHIGRWWTSEHSLSGKGSNMYFANKCFCETMPNGKTETVMTFVDRQRNKSAVLSGELGPLRGKAVEGKMTWKFNKDHHGTRVTMEYKVSGLAVADNQTWPTELDNLLEKQMKSFKASLSKR